MADATVWVGIFVGIYAIVALALARWDRARGAADGRSFFAIGPLNSVTFTLAATVTALPAFFVLGYPSVIRRDGFAAAMLGAVAIGIALVSVAMFKRLWLVGRHYGHRTLGDVLGGYFGGDAIRLPVVVVALAFAVPFVGLQLLAAGALVEFATVGEVDARVGAAGFGVLLAAALGAGGFRALARLGAVQAGLVAVGVGMALVATIVAAGGIGGVVDGLSRIATSSPGVFGTTGGRGGGDYHAFFAVAGVSPLAPAGGASRLWTVALGFSAALVAVGMATSPGYCQWPLGAASPRPFAAHPLWGLAVGLGAIVVIAAVILAVAGRPSGPELGLPQAGLLADDLGVAAGARLPPLLREATRLSATWPWAAALIVLAAIAATQASAGLALMAGAAVPREIGRWAGQPLPAEAEGVVARAAMLAIVIVDLVLIVATPDGVVRYAGLALGFGIQLAPPLVAALWAPWITRQGAVAGLIAGLVVSALAETQGPLFAGLGIVTVGRWPLGLHSAAWGLAVHLAAALLVSALTQDRTETARRREWHRFLDTHAGLPPERRPFLQLTLGATVLWAFLAVGPGMVIGNGIFGTPENGAPGWTFRIPSIWAWQILMWLAGIGLIVAFVRRLGLASVSPSTIEATHPSAQDETAGR